MKLKANRWIGLSFILLIEMSSSCSAVIVTVGDNGQVPEGSAAVLTCGYGRSLISSLAIPVFSWQEFINGSPVTISAYQGGVGVIQPPYSDSGRYTVEEDSILTVTNISRSDNGRIYQCEVTIIDDSPSTATDVLTLSVAFYGTMMFTIINNPVTEGESAMSICSVNANPDPVIILYKDETEIMRETATNLTYNIDYVTRSDAGNYKCEGSNIAGGGTSQIETLEVYSIGPPEFDLDEEVTVGPGDLYVIALEVSGNVIYQWTTDPPGIDDKDNNPETFTVNVPDVNVTMFTITVTVTNNIGSTIQSVKITVSEPSCNKQCKNGGICAIHKNVEECECPCFEGEYCQINLTSSSYMGLTIGMFFVGIFLGAFGLFAAFVGYMKVKQKTIVDKRSTDKRKQDPYMEYRAYTGNENQTYQDLQHKEEETVYVNVKPGKNKNRPK